MSHIARPLATLTLALGGAEAWPLSSPRSGFGWVVEGCRLGGISFRRDDDVPSPPSLPEQRRDDDDFFGKSKRSGEAWIGGGSAVGTCSRASTPRLLRGGTVRPAAKATIRRSGRKPSFATRKPPVVGLFALGGGNSDDGKESTGEESARSPQPTPGRSDTPARPLHLLLSPGSWRKIAWTTSLLFALRLFVFDRSPERAGSFLFPAFSSRLGSDAPKCHGSGSGPNTAAILSSSPLIELANNAIQLLFLPLLSSACCGVQLILNALAAGAGCAGFNTYLGPLRPYFVSLLLYSTIVSFPAASPKTLARGWIGTSALSWSIALMPEMVHWWNNRRSEVWHAGQKRNGLSHDDERVSAQHREGDARVATLDFEIPSMGCVACVNKIDTTLRRCSPRHVVESKSWLYDDPESKKGGGRARVVLTGVSSRENARDIAESMVDSVREAGFERCTIASVAME